MKFKVAFRKDATADGQKGSYHLSSKDFDHYHDAAEYADTISGSREPIVLEVKPYTHLGVLTDE